MRFGANVHVKKDKVVLLFPTAVLSGTSPAELVGVPYYNVIEQGDTWKRGPIPRCKSARY